MFFSIKPTVKAFLTIAVLSALPGIAMSTLLFESDSSEPGDTITSGAESGIISFFELNTRTEMKSFAFEFDLDNDASVNFFVYDINQGPNSNSGTLLYQGAKSFSDDGMSFKQSETLSLFLETDTTYGLGFTSGERFTFPYIFGPNGKEENGIQSLVLNQNLSGFASPEFGLSGSVELRTQIFGNQDEPDDVPPSASVPEPGTMALLSLGLLGMGVLRRKKSH